MGHAAPVRHRRCVYPNFPDPGLDELDRAYFKADLERVRRVEAAYGAPPA